MTDSISLKEQFSLIPRSMEMLAASVKEKDEQITFMMNKITMLTGKRVCYCGAKSEPKSTR